jgi:hypothetical protein
LPSTRGRPQRRLRPPRPAPDGGHRRVAAQDRRGQHRDRSARWERAHQGPQSRTPASAPVSRCYLPWLGTDSAYAGWCRIGNQLDAAGFDGGDQRGGGRVHHALTRLVDVRWAAARDGRRCTTSSSPLEHARCPMPGCGSNADRALGTCVRGTRTAEAASWRQRDIALVPAAWMLDPGKARTFRSPTACCGGRPGHQPDDQAHRPGNVLA